MFKLILILVFSLSANAQLLNPPQDSTINFTDITTNNFSITKHGFVPKGTNVGNCLKDNGSWGSCGAAGSGFDTIGTINSLTKSTNGASSTGSIIVMQTADTTNAGLISVGSQTISGDKTLSIYASTVSASTISNPTYLDETSGNFSTSKHGLVPKGTGIGNFLKDDGTWASAGGAGAGFSSVGTIDSLTKSTNGASSTGTTLVMQTADLTNAGLMSVGTQSISGDKTVNLLSSTFTNGTISGTSILGGSLNASAGVINNVVVSSTSTLGGTLTNLGIISGGTVSGSIVFGGSLNGAAGVMNNLVVSSTSTLGGTLTNKGTISGGIVSGTYIFGGAANAASAIFSNLTVSGATSKLGGTLTSTGIISGGFVSGTWGMNGTINMNNNLIPVSGTGLNFNARLSPTSASTTTVIKVLNDEQYGTWTPSYKGGTSDSSAITYTVQQGTWFKKGPHVCVTFRIDLSAITGGGGILSVSGTPYVVGTQSAIGGARVITKATWTTAGPDSFLPTTGTHAMQALSLASTGVNAINVNNLAATTVVAGQGCYITSE